MSRLGKDSEKAAKRRRHSTAEGGFNRAKIEWRSVDSWSFAGFDTALYQDSPASQKLSQVHPTPQYPTSVTEGGVDAKDRVLVGLLSFINCVLTKRMFLLSHRL